MKRSLIWLSEGTGGWGCSNCGWRSPLPSLLTGDEARQAFDRVAAARFNEHICQKHSAYSPPTSDMRELSRVNFSDRARTLIRRGYTPKVAVDLTLHEIETEHAGNARIMDDARADAEDFLQKVRKGLI